MNNLAVSGSRAGSKKFFHFKQRKQWGIKPELRNKETIMLNTINPTTTSSWQKLTEHYQIMKDVHMKQLFADDPDRFHHFSIRWNDILVDFSKNIITHQTLALLRQLAVETDLNDAISKMYSGDRINGTENRSVLHIALRNLSNSPVMVDECDVMHDVNRVLSQMENFSGKVRSGAWKGYTGKSIRSIVNIGIGGSDLGPVMVTECLKPYINKDISLYFVSNVDGTHIMETLKKVDPETTLFLVASKTFTTLETMTNAHTARRWFLEHSGDPQAVRYHFAAISTNTSAVESFGIARENILEFWDWVGGRYSLWSAIGLPIACAIGFNNFKELLAGAHDMDNHFKTAPLERNIPAILALIGIWYTNFFGARTEVILPYDQYMHRFPAYFQQGNMESNGKTVDRNGQKITINAESISTEERRGIADSKIDNCEKSGYSTGPVIWGEPGTNGQHAFYQLIHQGSQMIPADFLAPSMSHNPVNTDNFLDRENLGNNSHKTIHGKTHHNILLSNFFAQTEALLNGKELDMVIKEMKAKGKNDSEIAKIAPHKVFAGNKPTNSILFKKMTPRTLGSLIAMYEHKIFVQGVIWNIFSFDQWGVELGKELASQILPELENGDVVTRHDSSTNGLINTFKTMRM